METESERKARFLREERERYEYLLQCAEAAENEELAWETIESKLHIEDFVAAAKEALAGRELLEFARYVDADAPDDFRKFSNAMDGLRRAIRRYDDLSL